MLKPWRDDLPFDIGRLRRETERYRSEAREAPSEHPRKHLALMARLSETLASNEKKRARLDRSIVPQIWQAPPRAAKPDTPRATTPLTVNF